MGLFDAIRDLFGGSDGGSGSGGAGPASGGGPTGAVIDDRSEFGEPDHVPPGCLVGDSVEDLREMAEDYAGMWSDLGPTDYSVESIRGIDEMFATQQERANWLTIDLEDGRTGGFAPMAAQPACYFGEVMVRNYDADWVLDYDYGWALGFGGETVVNLFGTVHRALEGDPPFVRMHDTFVENYDLDGDPLDPAGERIPERRQPNPLDPEAYDEEEIERAAEEGQVSTAEDMREFAEDFAEHHPDYDLDYSTESLAAADAVVEEKFGTEEFADAEVGDTDDPASIALTAATTEAGAYYAEVIRRTTTAEWQYREEDGLKLEFPYGEAGIRLEPLATAESVVAGEASFEDSFIETLETVEEIEEQLDGTDDPEDLDWPTNG